MQKYHLNYLQTKKRSLSFLFANDYLYFIIRYQVKHSEGMLSFSIIEITLHGNHIKIIASTGTFSYNQITVKL